MEYYHHLSETFEVGDLVTTRSYDSLVNEFGLYDGDKKAIATHPVTFFSETGRTARILRTDKNSVDLADGAAYMLSFEAIIPEVSNEVP